jgi:hypothetical protein
MSHLTALGVDDVGVRRLSAMVENM